MLFWGHKRKGNIVCIASIILLCSKERVLRTDSVFCVNLRSGVIHMKKFTINKVIVKMELDTSCSLHSHCDYSPQKMVRQKAYQKSEVV